MKKKHFGFTLAEVLITLVIIGVIAALTVPALIQNTQKQEYVSALKKAYSTLSQATQAIMAEEGSPKGEDGWASSTETVFQMLKKYLSNIKECGQDSGCFDQNNKEGKYKFLNGGINSANWDTASNARKFIMADGMQVMIWSSSSSCESDFYGSKKVCTSIFVDLNGEKKPNTEGRDVFLFVLKENGLFPAGCDVENSCNSTAGRSCACKVIQENAMNY